MRLLLDENLSESLLPVVQDLYPESLHVRGLGAGGAPDNRVWELAKEHGCLLVTRDEDFLRLSLLRGAPPKVVWITIGNCSNADLGRLLRSRHPDILRFAGQDEVTFLALGF